MILNYITAILNYIYVILRLLSMIIFCMIGTITCLVGLFFSWSKIMSEQISKLLDRIQEIIEELMWG